jgi:AcrR family transcriptional regulator
MKTKNEIISMEPNARKRLLEAAADLFAEKGYVGTFVREIVEKAGVSKPILYYYFESKEGLFYAILKWAADAQHAILNEIFETDGTVFDRLIYLYRRVYEAIQEYPSLYKMIRGLIYGPPQGAPEYDYAGYQRLSIFRGNQKSRCG